MKRMDMPSTPPVASSMPARYLPLPGDGRVAFTAEACIAVRSLPSACQRCAQACPAGAVKVGEAGPELVADCLGCGRCAAACPTGALVLKSFPDSGALPSGNAPLHVECWKVPASLTGHAALRVPCLGGLDAGQLLEWQALLGDTPLHLIDRGWCAKCRAGGEAHPARAALDEAARLLKACDPQAMAHPGLVLRPLPAALMPAAIPEPAAEERIGRRAFFRRFAAEAAQAMPAPRYVAPRLRRGHDFPLPRRERLLAVLEALARQPAERLPAAVLPGLTLQKDCDHLGVCAGMCPTGALYLYEDEDHAGIGFEPRDCVACGLCAQACPARAIEVLSAGPDGQSAAAHILTQFPLARCEQCLTPFAAVRGATLCPACRRSRQLSQNLFGTHIAGAQMRPE
jgi:ferredoxin